MLEENGKGLQNTLVVTLTKRLDYDRSFPKISLCENIFLVFDFYEENFGKFGPFRLFCKFNVPRLIFIPLILLITAEKDSTIGIQHDVC